MPMKYSLALQTGLRGAGLGNEVVAWAKSYIAARELGFQLLRPSWTLNRYRLPNALGWSPIATARSDVMRFVCPTFTVTEARYRATGLADYGEAMAALAEMHGLWRRSPLVLLHEGMWGGYYAIKSARSFIWRELLCAPNVVEFVDRAGLPARGRPVVAVHVRLGDFASGSPRPGQFNVTIPVGWYRSAMRALEAALGDVEFLIFTNQTNHPEVLRLAEGGNRKLVTGRGRSAAVQEVAAMSSADIVVCSISSFSLLAAFLSGRPYLWFRGHLTDVEDGSLTIWGGEEAQGQHDSVTQRHIQRARGGAGGLGIPFAEGDDLPGWLPMLVGQSVRIRAVERDLLYYGVVGKEPEKGGEQ